MRAVIFDSSFLMAISKRPTTWSEDLADALGGYTPVLLECVEVELENMAKSGGRKGKEASVALQIARDFERRPSGKGSVDDELASSALGLKAPVATVDAGLIATLRSSKAQVVTLRAGRVWFG